MITSIQSSKNEEKIQYPEGATKEMIDISTKVVNALIENGFLKSKLGEEISESYTNRNIKFRVQQMVNYTKNIKDQHHNYFSKYILSEYTNLYDPNDISYLPKETMDKYVNFLGYKITPVYNTIFKRNVLSLTPLKN